jgi:hypothetical protein
MNDEKFENLFKDSQIEPNKDNVDKALKKAKAETGQKDTLMFAFVNIWVAMAELLAPLFANIAIKNSQSLNPKHKHPSAQQKETDAKSALENK